MKEPRWSALSIAKVENARIRTHHPTSCPFLSQSKIHRWDLDPLSPVNHTFNKQPMNSWIKPQHLGQREFFSSTNSLRPIAASHWNGDMNKVMDSQSPLPHDLNLYFLLPFSSSNTLLYIIQANLFFCNYLIISLLPPGSSQYTACPGITLILALCQAAIQCSTLTLGKPLGLNKKAHCIWGTSDPLAWGFHLGTLSSFQKFMEKLSCGEGRDSQGGSKDDKISPTVSGLDKCISSWVFYYQSGKGNIYE